MGKHEEVQMTVHVVKMKSGKSYSFRDLEIEDYELAARMAVRTAGDNQMLFGMNLQKELLKLLLVEANGKKIDLVQRENLKAIMNAQEYMALLKFVGELSGNAQDSIEGVQTKTS